METPVQEQPPKSLDENSEQLEEVKEGAVIVEKTATGFKGRAKWWVVLLLIGAILISAVTLMITADKTGLIEVLLKWVH